MHLKPTKNRLYFIGRELLGVSSLSSVRGGGRKRLRDALFVDSPLKKPRTTDDAIGKKLARLNERFSVLSDDCLSEEEAKLLDEFVICHFRGINFNRGIFKTSDEKNAFIDQACRQGLHSKMSHINAGIPLGKPLTPEEDKTLTQMDIRVRSLWVNLRGDNDIKKWWGGKKETFESAAVCFQARYTGQAGKTNSVTDKSEDISEEVWEKFQKIGVHRVLEDSRLLCHGTPLVSTGKTARHAVRYAVGRSLSETYRPTRADPRYRNTGKAKHRLIGMVYIILQTLAKYRESMPSDVLRLVHDDKIHIRCKYWNETEVSFPGGIPQANIQGVIPIFFPTFKDDWELLDEESHRYYQEAYGLTAEKYAKYRKGFRSTIRSEDLNSDSALFQGDWDISYRDKYGFTKEIFDAAKELLNYKRGETTDRQKEAAESLEIKLSTEKKRFKTEKELKKDLLNKLRKYSPYRKFKNNIRDDLIKHWAEKLFQQAKEIAEQKGKVLVYQNEEGEFVLVDEKSDTEVLLTLIESVKERRQKLNAERKAYLLRAAESSGESIDETRLEVSSMHLASSCSIFKEENTSSIAEEGLSGGATEVKESSLSYRGT